MVQTLDADIADYIEHCAVLHVLECDTADRYCFDILGLFSIAHAALYMKRYTGSRVA